MQLTPTDFARIIGEAGTYQQENGNVLIGQQSLMLRLVHTMQETGEYTAKDFTEVYTAFNKGRQ